MIFSFVTLENARFFSLNERKITSYMNLLVTIDFAEMLEWLPLVLLWYSHFCLVYRAAGRKINFFSGSHLAPKYLKVVVSSKKLVVIMTHTQTIFTLSLYQID